MLFVFLAFSLTGIDALACIVNCVNIATTFVFKKQKIQPK